jgi:hypothetical protein
MNNPKGQTMQTAMYETGRDYGAPQVLEITYPAVEITDMESGTQFHSVQFSDAVRNISGEVQISGYDCNFFRIGSAVLAEYDAGRYNPL